MDSEIRLTSPTLRVLKFFLEKPLEGRSGADVSRALNIASGTLYPLLARLESAGWVNSEWESIEPKEAARPRRRFYKLTGHGQTCANKALSELQMAPGALSWTS
jgi:PadR family transcriptional regulator, regulatory protein PadR